MIYFISGHRDLSYEDFKKYYIPKIKEVVEEDPRAEFIVGDCNGVDKYAMDYIFNNVMCDLTIYHMSSKPNNTPNNRHPGSLVSSYKYVYFRGGFKSDEERDAAMTRDSNIEIAYIKENRCDSGTDQNIQIQYNLK